MKNIKKLRLAAFSLLLAAILTSCYYDDNNSYGYDGYPGESYLALDWEVDEPDYIDVGTSAIPYSFYYGDFYYCSPGVYELYFDGVFWDVNSWASYAWEMDYEVYRLAGETGGYGYDGRDGADTYFTLYTNPYGPFVTEDRDYKNGIISDSLSILDGYEIIENTDRIIKIKKENADYGIKITYTKVEKRTQE